MALKTEYVNKIVSGKGNNVNVRALPGTNAKVLLVLKAGQTAGRSTGNTNNMSDGEWLQVKFYTPVLGENYGYIRRDLINLVDVPGTTAVNANTGNFKTEYSNKIVSSSRAFNVYELPSLKSPVLTSVPAGSTAGRSSGQYSKQADGEWLQVNLVKPIYGNKYGYVRKDLAQLSEPGESPAADQNASAMVNELITTDKKTLANIQKIYKVVAKMKADKIDTSKIEPALTLYLNRLVGRQNTLAKAESSGLLTITKVVNSGIKVTDAYMQQSYGLTFLHGKQIGIAPVVLIVGGVVIGGVVAATLYYMLKPDYEDSKLDFVVTDKLQSELDKYIPKDKQKDFTAILKAEAQPQLNDAYNAGKTDQKFGDLGSVVKYVLIFGGGFFIVDRFIMSQSAKRKAAK